MALFTNVKSMGLKLYDVRAHVNLSRFRPEFARLELDPYVKEGFRRKRILWLNHQIVGNGSGRRHEYDLIDKNVLFQDEKTNPVHGGIEREYARIGSWKVENGTMKKMLDLFVKEAGVRDGADMLVQFQRVTCLPGAKGQPSVEGWHVDKCETIGVICVDRENVAGGVSQFKNDVECFQTELAPGFLVVFKDKAVMHRVTEIESCDGINPGFRDVILIADY